MSLSSSVQGFDSPMVHQKNNERSAMKFNKKWVWSNSFLLGVLIGCIFALFNIYKLPPDLQFLYIPVGLAAFACGICIIFDWNSGDTYYEKLNIPLSAFTVHQYSNMIVLSHMDFAWSYTYKHEQIGQLKVIKAIQYYNRKKESSSFVLLPYESF